MQETWSEKLRERWKLKNGWQVVVVLLVFACTGFTVMFIKKPLLTFFAGEAGNSSLASVIYYILILPLYNILLLCYGFIFGQLTFFWAFEKRFVQRIISIFKPSKKKSI
jgi:hypothetical protein